MDSHYMHHVPTPDLYMLFIVDIHDVPVIPIFDIRHPAHVKIPCIPGIASVVHAFPGREWFESSALLLFSPTALLLIQLSTCSSHHCPRFFALKCSW